MKTYLFLGNAVGAIADKLTEINSAPQ